MAGSQRHGVVTLHVAQDLLFKFFGHRDSLSHQVSAFLVLGWQLIADSFKALVEPMEPC